MLGAPCKKRCDLSTRPYLDCPSELMIQTDNGSEFGSQFHWHLLDKGIGHVHMRPHKPG